MLIFFINRISDRDDAVLIGDSEVECLINNAFPVIEFLGHYQVNGILFDCVLKR